MIAGIAREWMAHHADAHVLWLSANGKLGTQAEDELRVLGIPDDVASTRVLFASYVANATATPHPNPRSLRAFEERAAARRVRRGAILRKQRTLYEHVEKILAAYPRAAVLYSSATMMSDPSHLLYLSPRFGLHTVPGAPFETPRKLRDQLSAGGASIMTLVAMFLQSRGLYVSRQLSMRGVRVSCERIRFTVTQERTYDAMVATLRREGHTLMHAQRVMRNLIALMKVDAAVALARAALARGECPVLIVAHTGAAATERVLREGEATAMPLYVQSSVAQFVAESDDAWDAHSRLVALGDVAQRDVVDALLHRLGGGEQVAEITGRTRRVVVCTGGDTSAATVERVSRSDEVHAFQSGQKRVAILSRAGGVGLSLHDEGTGRRCNILLELPWSAEDLMQIIGRTHRAAGHTAPAYEFCVADVPADVRVAYSVARRQRTLGAHERADACAVDTLAVHELIGAASTAHVRRTLLLRVRFARAVRALPQGRVEALLAVAEWCGDALERARLHAVAVARWASPHTASVGERLLSDLRDACDDPDREPTDSAANDDVLSAALVAFPDTFVPVVLPWTPEVHLCFGPRVRSLVMTLLCCAASTEARDTLGLLPEAVLFLIVRRCIWETDDLRAVASHWSNAFEESVATRTHETLLNAVGMMPVATQRSALKLLATSTTREFDGFGPPSDVGRRRTAMRTSFARDVCDVARDRLGSDVPVKCHVAEVRMVDADNGEYVVSMRYSVDIDDEDDDGDRWTYHRNVRSGTICRTEDGFHGDTVDGNATRIHADTHVRVPSHVWRAARKRRVRHLQKKCDAAPTEFRVATQSALHRWFESLKTIVSVAEPHLIGLLVTVA